MNAEQIKNLLLQVREPSLDFTVTLSGKASKKVNGLYKPETREIILHNKNFKTDNLLVYTAIHEYAHHIHACNHGGHLPARPHTQEFWATFHGLLEEAEKKGLYTNIYAESPDLTALTEDIRENYIKENGRLFLELGRKLQAAQKLCVDAGLRFEDYIDRILCMPRLAAQTAIKSAAGNLPPELGQDNMRFVCNISDEDERAEAANALLSGKSPDSVKTALRKNEAEADPKDRLEKEKARLERTIETLTKRLSEVEIELEQMD
jgi:hypothetical protein